MEDFTKTFAQDIANKKDTIIKDAFEKKGFICNEAFIKEHCTIVTYEGDNFDHIWYHHGQADGVRIISFERYPNFNMFDDKEPYKMKAELRYF
jgi:hypothetical protein